MQHKLWSIDIDFFQNEIALFAFPQPRFNFTALYKVGNCSVNKHFGRHRER